MHCVLRYNIAKVGIVTTILSKREVAVSESERVALPSLTAAALQILLVLADGERHGYAIMKEIAANMPGEMPLGPATLYRTIKRMLADGLVEEVTPGSDPAGDDERRRYYRITSLGRRVAVAELSRLEAVLRMARAKRLCGAS
jgi:DNA-binding PadR family transcriptional regulator